MIIRRTAWAGLALPLLTAALCAVPVANSLPSGHESSLQSRTWHARITPLSPATTYRFLRGGLHQRIHPKPQCPAAKSLRYQAQFRVLESLVQAAPPPLPVGNNPLCSARAPPLT